MSKELDTSPADASSIDVKEPPAQLATLARELIVRSKTNPRTHFDPDYIKELANSFREHGILQPLLVRPLPASRVQDTHEDREPGAALPTHEIVCGECRWRGAEGVLDDIPVLIRHLTDLQVLQVQLVENLKRRDLHPIEEAEGFERLINDHDLTVEDIAARVDKSVSQIYKTMKLLELTKECRDELYAGKLTRSTALLVARAPAYLQVQIAKDIMKPDYQGDTMSFRAAVRHIQQHYMLQLSNAVFDIKDASLVKKAGACGSCAKNTGANGDMFEDVTGAASCTDPKCFDGKKEAHYGAIAKAAEAKGQTVIQGKEAKELFAYEGAKPEGYRLLDEKDYIGGRTTSLRSAIGKGNVPTPVLIINPHTKEAQEALPLAVADKLLKKAAGESKAADKTKEPNERELQQQYRDAWKSTATRQIGAAILAGKIQAMSVDVARLIARHYLAAIQADITAELMNVEGSVARHAGMDEFLKTCSADKVAPALLLLMIEDETENSYYANGEEETPVIQLLATETGVDLQAVQDQVKEEMREAAEARKVKSEPKATKPAAKGAGNVSKKTKAPKTTAAEAKASISEALAAAESSDAPTSIADLEGKGLSSADVDRLDNACVRTLDELADLTVDELVEITGQTDDEAKALITKARSGWFTGSMGSALTATAARQAAAQIDTSKAAWPFPNKPAKSTASKKGTAA